MSDNSNNVILRIQQLTGSDKELFLEYKNKYKHFLHPQTMKWKLTDYEMIRDSDLHRFFTIDEWNTLQYEKAPAVNWKTGMNF